MKNLFSTPKKAVITSICIIAVAAAAAVLIGTVVIRGILPGRQDAGTGGQGSSPDNDAAVQQGVSLEQAKAAAFADAGVEESGVTVTKAVLDTEFLEQVYDIEFHTADTEYEYEISASNGTIREKNVETFRTPSDGTGIASAGNGADGNNGNSDSAGIGTGGTDNGYIGDDHAREIALAQAGLTGADVQYMKTKLDRDDGRMIYEVEFYSGQTEYEYEIDAVSGEIIKSDMDRG